MDISTVMHEHQLNTNGDFQNVKYQIGEFSPTCTGILDKVVHSPSRDVNNHYNAKPIWRTTSWKWLDAVQQLASEGYPVQFVLPGLYPSPAQTLQAMQPTDYIARIEFYHLLPGN